MHLNVCSDFSYFWPWILSPPLKQDNIQGYTLCAILVVLKTFPPMHDKQEQLFGSH